MRHDAIWPPPVYVATFSDGAVVRMSYYSPKSKPLQHANGRALACRTMANERERTTLDFHDDVTDYRYRNMLASIADRLVNEALRDWHVENCYSDPEFKTEVALFRDLPQQRPDPATDIVAGHSEQAGEVIADPFFGAPADVAPAKRKRTLAQTLGALRDVMSALEHAAELIASQQRLGCPAGPVAVPSQINDALHTARALVGVDA